MDNILICDVCGCHDSIRIIVMTNGMIKFCCDECLTNPLIYSIHRFRIFEIGKELTISPTVKYRLTLKKPKHEADDPHKK